MSIFRAEVLEKRGASHLGSIRIGRNLGFSTAAAVSLLLALLLIMFAAWGEFTRKARLSGLLVPHLGALSLTAPQAGTLLQVPVREGDPVRAGDKIALIDVDRVTVQGAAAPLIDHTLKQRRATLQAERELAQVQSTQRQQALDDRLRSLNAEQGQASAELHAVRQRRELARKTLERYQALAKDGFMPIVKVQEQQEALLDLDIRAQTTERNLTTLARDAQDLRAEKISAQSALQAQFAQLDRSLSALEQELTENQARGQVAVIAPQDGVMGALTMTPGQAVQPGQTLATLMPLTRTGQASPLEAHLYAASRAMGFVQAGQDVWLRYAAYPYQKFGMARGRISAVSRTPIDPKDLPNGPSAALLQAAQSNEPLYRVTVTLAQQNISAYGQEHPLKPGLMLEADVLQDRRAIWEWVFEPVLAMSSKKA